MRSNKSLFASITIYRSLAAILLLCIQCVSYAAPQIKLSQSGTMLPLGSYIDLIEDSQASFTFDSIKAGDHDYHWITNETKTPNFGYTDSVFWYRLTINNDTDSKAKKILALSYPLLDDVEFYYTDENQNTLKSVSTGDTRPASSREMFHRNFLFDLEIAKDATRYVYLRVATQGAQQLPLELWDEREFFLKDQKILMLKAAYFGMMTVVIIFNLFIYFSLREKSYIYYIVFISSFVLVQSAVTGFAAQYAWPEIPFFNGISILFFVPITMVFAALFGMEFLDLKNRAPFFYKALAFLILFNAVSAALSFFLPYSSSTKLSVALVVPVSLAILSIGPILWAKGVKEARFYSLAWFTFVFGAILVALNKFGLLPRNLLTEQGLVIGSALEAILLSIALADRFNREREQRYKAQQEKFKEASERQKIEEAMLHQSLHSPLTQLPNRVLLSSKLDELMERYSNEDFSYAIVLIHLTRFHEINKTLGHQNADELLILMSHRLKEVSSNLKNSITIECDPDGDIHTANIEGVTFAVLLRSTDKESTQEDIKLLSEQVIEPIEHNGMSLDVGASFGVAFYPEHGATSASLLRHAHIAIDIADTNEHQIAIYSKDINPYSARRLTLMGELRKAIEENSLELYYQPQIDLSTNSISGVEALLRWNHELHGFIPPDEFVPLAESTGIIKYLTQWVADKAIGFAAELKRNGHDICVSINISALNLQEKSFDLSIKELLEKHQLTPSNLLLEITETSVMKDTARCFGMLERLHNLGVKLSVDDFGTGHSSLAYIKKLTVEEIKIDRSFVMEMDKNKDDEVIVKTTIKMCHSLGYKIVAEGVENLEICTKLKDLGCDFIQGYYISRPLSVDDLNKWLTDASWEPLLVSVG